MESIKQAVEYYPDEGTIAEARDALTDWVFREKAKVRKMNAEARRNSQWRELRRLVSNWFRARNDVVVRLYDVARLEKETQVAELQGKREMRAVHNALREKIHSELPACVERVQSAESALSKAGLTPPA